MVRPVVPMSLNSLKNNSAKLTKETINRRKKAESTLQVAKNKLKPPKWLGRIAAEEFKYIIRETKEIELITNLDIHSLALYCNVYEQYIHMTNRIISDGIMVEANKSSEAVVTSHPLFIRQHQLMDQLRKLQGDLGLTPSSRAKLALAKAESKIPENSIERKYKI